jgi:hypothetical protein
LEKAKEEIPVKKAVRKTLHIEKIEENVMYKINFKGTGN